VRVEQLQWNLREALYELDKNKTREHARTGIVGVVLQKDKDLSRAVKLLTFRTLRLWLQQRNNDAEEFAVFNRKR
jgi:hypothetical protein